MLLISLFFSGIVLWTSFQRGLGIPTLLGLIFSIGAAFVGCLLPFVLLQTLLIVAVFAVCANWKLTDKMRYQLNALVSVMPYLIFGCWIAYHLPGLRDAHPYESLETRLPKPKEYRVDVSWAVEQDLNTIE